MKHHKKRHGRVWRRFSLMSLLVFMTIVAVFFVWRQDRIERQVIDQWIDAVLADAESELQFPDYFRRSTGTIQCPGDLSESQQISFLFNSLNRQPTAKRRNTILKILAEYFPSRAHDVLVKIATTTKHPTTKRNAILLAALYRVESDVNEFEALIAHDDPMVRSAAIDAIGIIYNPAFRIPIGKFHGWTVLSCEPEIDLRFIKDHVSQSHRSWINEFQWASVSDHPVPIPIQENILTRMLTDEHESVRSAAARVLKNHPPEDYQLRIAEWGVWIHEDKELTLIQSVFDEIPEFVHRTNDSIKDISKLRQIIFPTTKPILHFHVNQPMVIDLTVRIFLGRPWFVYPAPDDYSIHGLGWMEDSLFPPEYSLMDPIVKDQANTRNKIELREGYPWLTPNHQTKDINDITEIGFRWQSLIALPEKADWMQLEPITEEKYSWWGRLRDVPAAWISNRGESDRFVYYDGPTECASPVHAQLKKAKVQVTVPLGYPLDGARSRHFLYIDVNDEQTAGVDRKAAFERERKTKTSLRIDQLPLKGDAVKQRLTQILVEYGLNLEEAEGLVDCWTPQFFETKGKRFLTIFGTKEYNLLCPIKVSPTPTELVRVGIVLQEFSEDSSE